MSMSPVSKYYNSPNSLSRSPGMFNAQTHTTAHKARYVLPFAKNPNFVGRKNELEILSQRLLTNHESRTAIVGPSGTGKTQIALQFAHVVKDTMPAVSIFWIPAWSRDSFGRACKDVLAELQTNQADISGNDAKAVVREYLSSDEAGQWLVVLDHADVYQGELLGYIPQSKKGMTLITFHPSIEGRIATKTFPKQDILPLGSMSLKESVEFLQKSLIRKELAQQNKTIRQLLRKLACWPLAIAQTAAYLNMNNISVAKYMQLLNRTEQDLMEIGVEQFLDSTHNENSTRAIVTTLMVSFSQLRERSLVEADLLAFISCIGWRAIPRSLLIMTQSEERAKEAINILCSYALLSKCGGEVQAEISNEEWYDMHPVVHSAARIWTSKFESVADTLQRALKHATNVIASSYHANEVAWKAYRPHALCLLRNFQSFTDGVNAELSLLTGQCLLLDEKFTEAVYWLEVSFRWRQGACEETDANRLLKEYMLAIAYRDSGRFKEAVALLEHVVGVQERVLTEHHPHRLASQRALALAYKLNRQSVFMATTSRVPSLKISESNERDEDQNSVLSYNRKTSSQIGIEVRTRARLRAINVLGTFFWRLKELRPLHDNLSKRLGYKRFVNYYCRILKFYALKLEGRSEARTYAEEVTIRVLKSQRNRNDIARRLIELFDLRNQYPRVPLDLIDGRLITKKEQSSRIEELASYTHDLAVDQIHTDGIFESEEDSDEDCDDSGKTKRLVDPQDDFDISFFSVIDGAKEFLRRHMDIFSLELRLLLLPASLREVVKTVPREDIHISHTNDVTIINRIKALVEDNTAIEWDWWPLKSRVPDLPPDRQRLEWQVGSLKVR
ncbi:P-loop containing nucleoside triphosphate hydrolase protein [Curvularia clavata]|uniref:P-loop containing nucleoside triphosphate hydrolase protein n=1 Tax=Curvularia clavata TaxID=95742 RepID=A0A9Q9DQE1_CURCL|nr:P-loop containing nucleoside triphosphate hydrolase protein [Curvularia clavata]